MSSFSDDEHKKIMQHAIKGLGFKDLAEMREHARKEAERFKREADAAWSGLTRTPPPGDTNV